MNDPATNATYGGKDICYKLTANLDLSSYGQNWNGGKDWTPIGTSSNRFKGTFDGNGRTITGLFIKRTEDNAGLFDAVDGTVQNLALEAVSITGSNYVGSVAGYISLLWWAARTTSLT